MRTLVCLVGALAINLSYKLLTIRKSFGLDRRVISSSSPASGTVVRFTAPHQAEVVPFTPEPLRPAHVRVRTLYSGISAGTELTAYRGTNVYLTKQWDAERRLFIPGEQTLEYPVTGWGYSEVGEVIEVAEDSGPHSALAVGDRVYGIWGHRSEAVVAASRLEGHQLADTVEPLHGVFARVGAIALNAILAAGINLGETVAVFGQGVIGLLATRMAALSGAVVVAVDTKDQRLEMASQLGAAAVINPLHGDPAAQIRTLTSQRGADTAIELSGSYPALHEAIRSTAVNGAVVAAGFYQGEGVGLNLGEEFHLNRIKLVSSQISGVPAHLDGRWNVERLQSVVLRLIQDGRLDVSPLVSHVVPVREAPDAYRMLDQDPGQALQVVLDFT